MSSLWQETLPTEPGRLRARDDPSLMVINLGTNDFAPTVLDTRPFEKAYADLVHAVRSAHPTVPLLLAWGPMLTNLHPAGMRPRATVEAALRSIHARQAQDGDTQIALLEFRPVRPSEGFGADYHPSRLTQARMAEELCNAIRRFPGALVSCAERVT